MRSPRSGLVHEKDVIALTDELLHGRIGRRQFLQRGAMLGLGSGALSALLAACGGASSSAGSGGGKPSGPVTAGVANNVGKFDPHVWSGFTSNIVTNHVYQGLVRLNFETNALEPALATRWEQPSPTTWRFHLRTGVTFHDGSPFTADDVIYSTQRSRKVSWGGYGWASFDSIKALDPHTVEVKLKYPDWRFQWAYYWPPGAIVSKKYFEKVGQAQATLKPSGTNAFKVTSSSTNQVVMSKFADYWESGLPYLDQVMINVLDASTIVQSLKVGDVNLSTDVPLNQVKLVAGFGDTAVKSRVGPHIVMSYPNITRPPFNDVKVRRAVMEALNNPAALSAFPSQYYEPSKGALIHSSFKFSAFEQANAVYTANLQKAKQMLQASSHPNGFTIDWMVVATRSQELSAVLGAQQQLKGIGVNVNVHQMTDGDVSSALYTRPRPFDIITYNWLHNQPNTLDPLAAILGSANEASTNFMGYHNPAADKLIEACSRAADENAIGDKLKQLQMMCVNDAAIFPHGWDGVTRSGSNKLNTPNQSILGEWDDWYRTSKWA
jgi:peptide/nickel transport system substrate-binding protein